MIERTEKTALEEWGGVTWGRGLRPHIYHGPLLAFDLFQWSHDYN